MRIAIYGGSFNPPHLGHLEAAKTANEALKPDKLLIIPDNIPPHKEMCAGSPTAEERFKLCEAMFSEIQNAEISDMELKREGKSYTSQTVDALRELYPDDELVLIIGTDMLLTFDSWFRAEYLMRECTLAALKRENGDDEALAEKAQYLKTEYSAKITIIPHTALPMSSSEIREGLPKRLGADKLSDSVYSLIIKHRFYNAKPDFEWLRQKAYAWLDERRIPHVQGCEQEAVRLALRYGEDTENAAVSGILHDITKKLKHKDQLILCEKYDIICDNAVLENPKLMHAITGAAVARELFGVSDEVYSAIRYHTTGKPDMTKLQKIIYLADYIEPTRDFPGVDELRRACYESLDAGLALGLKMSLEEIRSYGSEPYVDTVNAYEYYKNFLMEEKEC